MRGKTQAGFSLIETIVGLAVILAAFILFTVVLSTVPLTRAARNQNIAYHIAEKKIEELRNTAYDSLPASGPFTDPTLAELASSSAELIVSDYEGSDDVKQVTVQVSWEEQFGAESLNLDTLIYEHGLNQK